MKAKWDLNDRAQTVRIDVTFDISNEFDLALADYLTGVLTQTTVGVYPQEVYDGVFMMRLKNLNASLKDRGDEGDGGSKT